MDKAVGGIQLQQECNGPGQRIEIGKQHFLRCKRLQLEGKIAGQRCAPASGLAAHEAVYLAPQTPLALAAVGAFSEAVERRAKTLRTEGGIQKFSRTLSKTAEDK